MSLDLAPLFARAFFTAEAIRSTDALVEARKRFGNSSSGRAFSFEVPVPDRPDHRWFEEALVRKLVYFCESTSAPLPRCTGVFVSFFAGPRLYCVSASEVIAYASEVLGLSSDQLVARYGTGEVRKPVRLDG